MTQEQLRQQEESSKAFKALATPFVEKIIKDLGLEAAIPVDHQDVTLVHARSGEGYFAYPKKRMSTDCWEPASG